ncbi:MAG: DUF971 domain-containing protein [Planctomycetes bacterium]|nr:DUF971 domain-containing protein [Planctomycetota bacterium]
MAEAQRYEPSALEKTDEDHVAITWGDGARFVYPMNWLRSRCPCASCVEEWTGVVKVRFEDVEQVRVKRIYQVGSYAFGIAFDDGHDTGIFTYRKLRDWGEELARA